MKRMVREFMAPQKPREKLQEARNGIIKNLTIQYNDDHSIVSFRISQG